MARTRHARDGQDQAAGRRAERMAERIRLDIALEQRGLVQSRARARDAVLRGTVQVNGVPASKPGQLVGDGRSRSTIDDPARRYVSRAALKLIAGLDAGGDRGCGQGVPRPRRVDRRVHAGAGRARGGEGLCGRCRARQLHRACGRCRRWCRSEGVNAKDLTHAADPRADRPAGLRHQLRVGDQGARPRRWRSAGPAPMR